MAVRHTAISEMVRCEEMCALELMNCSSRDGRLCFTRETCGWYLKGSQDFPHLVAWEVFLGMFFLFSLPPQPKHNQRGTPCRVIIIKVIVGCGKTAALVAAREGSGKR